MIILSKKRFGFVKQDGSERLEADKFVTKGNMTIEDAPDWINDCPLFKLAIEASEIVTVNGKTPKAEAEAIAKAKQVKTEEVEAEEK